MFAAREAVEDGGLADAGLEPDRVGVIVGSSTGDLIRNERYVKASVPAGLGPRRLTDAWNHFFSTSVDIIASEFGFEGLRSCIVAACASSTMAVGAGLDAIRYGRADAVLAGGTDSMARLTFSGFNALRVMDPEACRPFYRGRAGMNIGEGAAMLVLEEFDAARRRGARIYAEVVGHSLTCEAFHPTSPEPDGRADCRRRCGARSRDARIAPTTSITSTRTGRRRRTTIAPNRAASDRVRRRAAPAGDVGEVDGRPRAGRGGRDRSRGRRADRARGVIPPTIHHTETDPECDVDVVANEAREMRGRLRGVDVARLRRQRRGRRPSRV